MSEWQLPYFDPYPDGFWEERAACRGKPASWFFPERGDESCHTSRARECCAGCEVRVECLEMALRNCIQHGIWGGCGPRERRKIRAERAREERASRLDR